MFLNDISRYHHVGLVGYVTSMVVMATQPDPTQQSSTQGDRIVQKKLDDLSFVLRTKLNSWSVVFDEIALVVPHYESLSSAFLHNVNEDAKHKLQTHFLG